MVYLGLIPDVWKNTEVRFWTYARSRAHSAEGGSDATLRVFTLFTDYSDALRAPEAGAIASVSAAGCASVSAFDVAPSAVSPALT